MVTLNLVNENEKRNSNDGDSVIEESSNEHIGESGSDSEEENGNTDTETENTDTDEDEFEIEGRRIVDMGCFLEQLQKISRHNNGNCSFDVLKIKKELRVGLHSKIIFACTNCNRNVRVYANDNERTTDTLCINSSAVLGANMIGIGHSQLEQFTSVLDVPTMCNDKFKTLNDKLGEFWEETAEDCMREAAEEERNAAIERGDVDPDDGVPFITVVSDECWSKRSQKKFYCFIWCWSNSWCSYGQGLVDWS